MKIVFMISLLSIFPFNFIAFMVMGKDGGINIVLIQSAAIAVFVPSIYIESRFLSRNLSIPLKKLIKITTLSNFISTFITVPFSWDILVYFQAFLGGAIKYNIDTLYGKILPLTLQAPWMIIYDEKHKIWMVPTACLVLIIPFFFVSWKTKFYITNRFLKDMDIINIKWTIFKANLITYVIMALLTVFVSIYYVKLN